MIRCVAFQVVVMNAHGNIYAIQSVSAITGYRLFVPLL